MALQRRAHLCSILFSEPSQVGAFIQAQGETALLPFLLYPADHRALSHLFLLTGLEFLDLSDNNIHGVVMAHAGAGAGIGIGIGIGWHWHRLALAQA